MTRIRNIFVRAFREAESEAAQSLSDEAGRRPTSRRVMVVCVTAALCMTATFYLGTASAMATVLGPVLQVEWTRLFHGHHGLARLVWWAGVVVVFYLLVPGLVVKGVLRERLSDYGFRLGGLREDAAVYAAAMGILLPVVWVCSATVGFQSLYPFYHPPQGESLWPTQFLWEGVYWVQFLAVEFFFRGFMLHGIRARFGFHAVFVMMMPYCMVHFGKPAPEVLAAIVAGIVLGVFSLKSRSILPGFLLHCGTALAMDLSALWRKGFFDG